jgi:transposase-like protein
VVLDSGRSVADVAKRLCIHETTWGNWVKEAKEHASERDPRSVRLAGMAAIGYRPGRVFGGGPGLEEQQDCAG